MGSDESHSDYHHQNEFCIKMGSDESHSDYHHQNEFCIKMGSDESPFNASLTVKAKITKTVFTDHSFGRGKESRSEESIPRHPLTFFSSPASLTPYR